MRTRRRRSWTIPVFTIGALLFGVAGHVHADGFCAKARYKIAGVAAKAKAYCYARAAGAGAPVDATCLANADQRLAERWAKATAKGGCPTSADAAAAQSVVDGFIGQLAGILDAPTVSHCCSVGSSCFGGPSIDEAGCFELQGTLGAPGSVCEGATGTCVAPPGAGGPCCTLPQLSVCAASPTGTAAECDQAGGFDVPDAVCGPTGVCLR